MSKTHDILVRYMQLKAMYLVKRKVIKDPSKYFDDACATAILDMREEVVAEIYCDLELNIFTYRVSGLTCGTCVFCLNKYKIGCNTCRYKHKSMWCYKSIADSLCVLKANEIFTNKIYRMLFTKAVEEVRGEKYYWKKGA